MQNSDPSRLLDRLPAARSVGLADPQQPDGQLAEGEIVLGMGLDPAAAAALLRAGGAARVAAVVLDPPAGPARHELTELAAGLTVELRWRPGTLSWRELHRQLSERLGPATIGADDELAELAQTIATLTGGLVTIEDTSARVLAYSRSSDEVDELRRLSILGRSGPPAYLALLREWGVYDRLAASEEVVEIAEHPQSGVRRRLAVGVFAGHRQLGTIWLQQAGKDFEPHAGQALLGAARLTAAQLADHGRHARGRPGAGLAELLAAQPGDALGPELTARLGADAAKPCAVVAFALSDTAEPAAQTLQLGELSAIVTVHGAALRRRAVAEQLAGRVYLLLPGLDSAASALPMLTDAIGAVRRHLDAGARARIGSRADSVAAAARSRRAADLALTVPGTEPVLDFDAVRSRLIVRTVENSLCLQSELHDPRLAGFLDTEPELARTLLDYLDTGSDVVRVAAGLGVHPTTVRYRLRRAVASLQIELADADDRLAVQLQLRCGLRTGAKER